MAAAENDAVWPQAIAHATCLEKLFTIKVVRWCRGRPARGEAGWPLPATHVFTLDEIAALRAFVPHLEGRTAKQRNPHLTESLAWAAWAIARL